MKKRILLCVMSIFLMFSGVFLLTACGDSDNPPPTPPTPPSGSGTFNWTWTRGIYFTSVDVETFDPEYNQDLELSPEFFIEQQGDVAVWVADYYDKDSLKVCLNDEEIELTFLDAGDDYDSRYLSPKCRKVAKFTWDFIWEENPEDLTFKSFADDAEIHIKFVSNGQTFSDEEQAVLSDWCLSNADGADLLSLLDSDYTLNIAYRELIDYYWTPEEEVDEDDGESKESYVPTNTGIRYTNKKRAGYYESSRFFEPVDSNLNIVSYRGKKKNYDNLVMWIDNKNGTATGAGLPQNIDITFDKEYLCLAELRLTGENFYYNHEIATVYNGNEKIENYECWFGNNENDIKIYIEPYTGVDLSNVEVYIYNTKMELKTDASKGKKYFVIEKGKLPIDYYTYTEKIDLIEDHYFVTIKDIDLSDSNLFKTLELKYPTNKIADGYIVVPKYYTDENGVTYYKPTTNATVELFNFENYQHPSKFVINGTEFDLHYYLTDRSGVTQLDSFEDERADELDKYFVYYDGVSHYVYKIKIGSRDAVMNVNIKLGGTIQNLILTLAITGNTTIEFVF